MRTMPVVLPAALLAAVLLVGCSTQPPTPTPGPGSGGPPSGLSSFELKERFSLDTGIKKDDGKPTGATGIAVSADGKLALAMATVNAGNVQVWDLENRKKLYQYDNPIASMLPVAISPDGKLGAYATQKFPSIALIDLTNGKEARQLRKKGNVPLQPYTTGLTFSPKGDLLIVASGKEIIGWDPTTGDERFVWTEAAQVSALSGLFDDGQKIASGTEKGGIKVWDVATGKAAQTLVEGGADKIGKLFISGDGKRLGAYESFGPIKIWDLTTGKVVNDVRGDPGLWCSMRFLPDNRTVVYNGDWAFFLQDTVSGETKSFAEKRDVRHYPVAATPDGSTLLSSEEDAKITVWDLKSTH